MAMFRFDGATPARMLWNRNSSVYERFDRVWPKAIIDGTLVYAPQLVFYISGYYVDTPRMRKFIKSLGMSWDQFVSQEVDSEIELMWFKLNRGVYQWSGETALGFENLSPTGGLVEPTKAEIAQTLNDAFKNTKKFTVTIDYGGGVKRYLTEHDDGYIINEAGEIVPNPLNTKQIYDKLMSNPWYFLANSRHKDYTFDSRSVVDGIGSYVPINTAVADVASSVSQYGAFAVLGDTNSFEQIGEYRTKDLAVSNTNAGTTRRIQYEVDYKFHGVTETSKIVNEIIDWYTERRRVLAKGITLQTPDEKTSIAFDTIIKRNMRSMMNIDPIEDSLWLDNQYLKHEAVRSMKKRDFAMFLGKSLGTDYSVEDASWWEGVLAIVLTILILVIAFYLAAPTGGASFSLVELAAFAGYAAIGFAIGGVVLAKAGGLSAQSNVRLMGSFSTILGYIGSALGIMAMVQNLAKEAAKRAVEEAGKKVTEGAVNEALKQVTIGDIVNEAVSKAVDSITSIFTHSATQSVMSTANGILDMLKGLMKGYEFYADQQEKKTSAELDALKAEEERYNEEVLNKPYMFPAPTMELTNKRLMNIDMLTDLDIEIQSKIGADKNFRAWEASVA